MDNKITDSVLCPYFPDREFVQEIFLAGDLTDEDVDGYINTGFRRFGAYFFRPACETCRACIPVRVRVDEFVLSKSMKKIAKKGLHVKAVVKSMQDYNPEYYKIYHNHSVSRFGIETDENSFLDSFFHPSAQELIVEYWEGDTMFGIGFLDKGKSYLSSIYFAYLPGFEHLSPGHLSVLIEISIAKSMKVPFYCLGYWIKENHHMNYKTRYRPHEFLDLNTFEWKTVVPG